MDAHELYARARQALRGADPRTALRLSAEIREAGADCVADAVEVEARVSLGSVPWALSFGDSALRTARDRSDPALGTLLAAVGTAALAAGEVYTAHGLFAEAERTLDTDDPIEQATLQLDIARLSLRSGEPAVAEERAAAALGAYTDADDAIGCGFALLVAAESRRATGDGAGARDVLGLASDRLSHVRGGPQVQLWGAEGEHALWEGNGADALRSIRRALGRLAHADAPLCARLWTLLGDAHDQLRASPAALHAWRTAASLYESGAGDGTAPLTAEALAWLKAGRAAEAAGRLRSLLDRAERAGRVDRLEVLHTALLACAATSGDWPAWDEHLHRAEGLAARTMVHQTVAVARVAAERCTEAAIANGDPRMLSRAVRAGALLLHGCEKLGRSADALAAGRVLAELGARGAPIPAGPFDLVSRLGAGAMGAVWSARHHDRLLDVAVKLLPPAQVGDERWDALLASEIRSVAALDHPNIVRILGTGRLGSASEAVGHGAVRVDSPWFAMELAADGTLESLCGNLDWRACRAVLLALLDALAHAHARGVIHLDLKPSNVLLRTLDDGRTHVVLSDFGLARVWSHTHGGAWVAGTPFYMAPEQFLSESRDVGPRTDLYGLGCLAWHLVTGDVPFVGEGPDELREMHTTAPLPELRARTAVPPGFDVWVRRLLAKRPTDRFATAADAAWALRRLKIHAAVEDGPRPVPSHWEGSSHAVLQDRGAGSDTALAMAGLRRAPLVGRKQERDLLWETLRRVSDEHHAAIVLLTGDEGMGKTALARWFTERALELGAAEVLDAGPGTDGQHGLRALAHRALRLDGLSAEVAAERVRERFPNLPDHVATGLGILSAEHGVALEGSERVACIVALVTSVAADRPVVVRLAPDRPPDPDQLAVVAALGVLPARVVVVAEGGDPDDPAFERAARVSLDRMTDEDIGALLDARLPLVPELRSRVVSLAGGRPDAAVKRMSDLVARDLLIATARGCALRVEMPLPGEPRTAA